MIVLIEATPSCPIDFELNSSDEVIVVGDYKNILEYIYNEGASPQNKAVYTPKTPHLKVDDFCGGHFNVSFRQNGEVVVNGAGAEVIKECLKTGCSFNIADDRLYYIEEQMRMKRKMAEVQRKLKDMEDERNHAYSDWKIGEHEGDNEPYYN